MPERGKTGEVVLTVLLISASVTVAWLGIGLAIAVPLCKGIRIAEEAAEREQRQLLSLVH